MYCFYTYVQIAHNYSFHQLTNTGSHSHQYEELRETVYNDIHVDNCNDMCNEDKLKVLFSISSFIRKFASYVHIDL